MQPAAICRREANGFAKVVGAFSVRQMPCQDLRVYSPCAWRLNPGRPCWRWLEKAQKSSRHKKGTGISKKRVIRQPKVWKRDKEPTSKCPHATQARAEKAIVLPGPSLPSSQTPCPTPALRLRQSDNPGISWTSKRYSAQDLFQTQETLRLGPRNPCLGRLSCRCQGSPHHPPPFYKCKPISEGEATESSWKDLLWSSLASPFQQTSQWHVGMSSHNRAWPT